MSRLQDLSYRIKVPLALSLVIVFVAAIVAILLGARIYADARTDLLANAESLGKTLARALKPVMLRDEVWQAYEVIMAPLGGEGGEPSAGRSITVVDSEGRIYVSSDPMRYPLLSPVAQAFSAMTAEILSDSASTGIRFVENPVEKALFVVVPVVADDGAHLGSVLLGYSQDVFLPRFYSTVQRVVISTILALAILLPMGWKFGRQLAAPLIDLADAMARVGETPRKELARDLYRGGDEIGRLAGRFEHMLHELEDKQRLQREMVAADRLAAIGRLTAGIAHEINNPLAGMLTAIDTARKHGDPDPVAARALSLVERGLCQIRDTVGALLVEARIETRAFTLEDVNDVRTLLEPEAQAREQNFQWDCSLRETIPLPSTSIRQILINLVLNAIEAAGQEGKVICRIGSDSKQLSVEICNNGRPIPAERLQHLFEPFSSSTDSGSGLGLWVTYQIVEQLRGTIRVRTGLSETEFAVALPLGAAV